MALAYLFAIDESKYRANGLKIPHVNIFDKHVFHKSMIYHARLLNEHVATTTDINCYIPNALTTCSLLVRLFGLACLAYDSSSTFFITCPRFLKRYNMSNLRFRRILAGICFFLGYYFDCLDGFYARKYNACTLFGCWFDHLNDIITTCAFFALFIYKKMFVTSFFMIVMGFFVLNQVIIEEESFNNYTDFFALVVEALSCFRLFNNNEFMRYFGTTSWFIFIAIMMMFE